MLFHKIHCGAVSIEKDKYLTPAYNSKITRSAQGAQYGRYQSYEFIPTPELFHVAIKCPPARPGTFVVVVSGIQPEKAQLPKPGRGPPQLAF